MHSLVCQTKLASHDTAAVVCDDQCVGDSSHDLSHNSSNEDVTLNTQDFDTIAGHSADPDEAEILALIGEQIPRYRLRTDTVTDYTGYNCTVSNETETALWEEDDAETLEETEEYLNYFGVNSVLCAERVSQMTTAYNDIEAVTHLLEEKERDLELTARIGQTLLSKNKELNNRVEALEDELVSATEKVNQLRHDLGMKDGLLKYYNEDLEHETRGETDPKSGLEQISVDFLETKVKLLEDENVNLRLESAQLKAETDSYEEKEKKLVEDCIQQLAEVNLQVESLAEELHQKTDENIHRKEEATKLLTQVTDLQKKIRKLTLENMDMREKLTASTESQRKLTQELGVMQDKYDELLEMLEEAQDELRLMSRDRIHSRELHQHSDSDSLASELETSLQQELSQSGRRDDSWRVFETARAAKQVAAKRETSSGTRMSLVSHVQHQSDSNRLAAYASDVESVASDNCTIDMDSFYESNPQLGQPGVPGSTDLESALKRLALRRANEQNEKDFQDDEIERRRRTVQTDMHDGANHFSNNRLGSPVFRSPGDSLSSRWNSTGSQHYKLPEKLQIVKPLEGSMTLRHWQHLATPHLAGIFEERHGVQMKGGSTQDLTDNNYSLSDLEEDDPSQDVHTRKEQDIGLTYTFTDSTVRNPGSYGGLGSLFSTSTPLSGVHTDNSMNTEIQAFQAPTISSESQHPQILHQHKQPVDNTRSTFSMSLGLAALLQGRESTGHALTRVSTSKPVTTTSELPASSVPTSNSDLHQTFFTSRSFDSQPLTSTPKIILGSRSFDHTMTTKDERIPSFFDSGSTKNSEPVSHGVSGKGFLQQLKSKGYSLYGLWGSGGKSNQSNPDSSADGAMVTEDDGAPIASATFQTVSTDGAEAGVLSALTNFRRTGMF